MVDWQIIINWFLFIWAFIHDFLFLGVVLIVNKFVLKRHKKTLEDRIERLETIHKIEEEN